MHIDYIGDEDNTEANFTIHNISDETLKITVVDGRPGYFKLDIPEEIKPGETANCRIQLVDQRQGRITFEKSITIELSDAAHTRFTIPVARRSGKGSTTASTDTSGH